MKSIDSIDRPRGVLSEADRRYLSHPEEYSDQGAYERRENIRKRVRNALFDFELLADPDIYPDSELEKFARREAPLVDDADRDTIELPDPWIHDALIELAAFMYRAAGSDEEYRSIMASGRSTARRRRVDLTRYGKYIRAKWRAGDPWSDRELNFAIHNPDLVGVDDEAIVEHARASAPTQQFEDWIDSQTLD